MTTGVRSFYVSLLAALMVIGGAANTAAQGREYLCDPANENCRDILINYIRNERVGIDVAFWFMEDARYTAELRRAFDSGVPVRVLMDTDANGTYPLNAERLSELRNHVRTSDGARIPMRQNNPGGYILHWKMMLFRGQGVVEFSGANYSADALRYEPSTAPYVNYVDEAIYFTDVPGIVNSFREKFDDFWVDTASWRNHANVTAPLMRVEPDGTYVQDPELNFPPEQNYRTRALQRYTASRLSSTGRGVDTIMYRITDQQHTNAMIALEQRGVPVRLITEQAQYRLSSRMWHSWNVDRLYMAGVEIRDRAHAGLNHQKSVIIYDQSTTAGDQPLVIFGSSNWTSPSAGGQVEHNLFTSRSNLVSWFIDQFDRKWNNLATSPETKAFAPLPPDKPTAPFPANLATGVPTTATLKWNGGTWAHLYDLYLDTNPNPTTRIGTHETDANLRELPSKTELSAFPQTGPGYALPVGLLQPGTRYYWRVVGKTMALRENASAVWSFTTAGSPPPPPPNGNGEVVLYAANAPTVVGAWARQADATAAGGFRLSNPNAGAAKIATAAANPANYFEATFQAETGRAYHLWIRGRAESNYWGNDSVFVQFSGSVTSTGTPTWRIGTTSATEVNLEDCSGCGISNWGWQDNGWGTGVMGSHVYFAAGAQTIRVQVREDGFQIDQIVLSPVTHLTAAPGPLRNDTTILAESDGSGGGDPPPPPPPPPPAEGELVLYAAEAAVHLGGGWTVEADTTAAGGQKIRHPNAGAAKLTTALAEPVNFVDLSFNAESGRAYRLWMRGRADGNNWANDSVFVQFDGSITSAGAPTWRVGTASAAEVNLEDCSGCGVASWGWQDNGWGVNVLGPLVYFAATGPQTMRIQTREDGFAIDQIVLSASMFMNDAPGALTNDTTILAR